MLHPLHHTLISSHSKLYSQNIPLHTPHCTLHKPNATLYTVHCTTLFSFAPHTPLFYSWHSAVPTVDSTFPSLLFTYTPHFILSTQDPTHHTHSLHFPDSTLHPFNTLHSTPHSKFSTPHSTLCASFPQFTHHKLRPILQPFHLSLFSFQITIEFFSTLHTRQPTLSTRQTSRLCYQSNICYYHDLHQRPIPPRSAQSQTLRPPTYYDRIKSVGCAASGHPFWSVSFRWWVRSRKRKESVKCGVYRKDCAVQKVNSALWSVKCREWSAGPPHQHRDARGHPLNQEETRGHQNNMSCETSNIVDTLSNIVVCQKVSREPQ